MLAKKPPTKNRKLFFALAGFFLSILTFVPAHAAGTASGTLISNSILLQCSVCGAGGIASNTPSFLVDDKVVVTVTESNGAVTSVSAGQSAAVTTFTVTNNGNTTHDYGLTAANIASGATLFGGTDNFDATACIARVESGATPGYDAADTVIFIDELAPDASKTAYVVCNIPPGQLISDQAIVSLTATTLQGGAPGVQGAITAQTAGADTAGIDVVFADASGSDDAVQDGNHSARDAYLTSPSVSVSLAETVTNVQDPFGCNAASGCKIVPGSILTYQVNIIVSGSGNADGLTVTDPVPANMSYMAGSTSLNSIAKTDAADGDKVDFNVTSPNTITFSPGTVTAPITYILTFRLQINP